MHPYPLGRTWTAAQARSALADAPRVCLDELCRWDGPLLVLAPHPDDETLGCGGLIALAAAQGLPVTVAVLTDGGASHPRSTKYPPDRLAAVRRAEAEAAVALLTDGRARFESFGAPDGRLGEVEGEALAWLERAPAATVFVTWVADPHPDHQAAFRIAERHAARLRASLYAYPVWGLTLPDGAPAGVASPCVRLGVERVLALKRQAMALHRTQTTDLIDDDPEGFRLFPEDLARHAGPYEAFLAVAPWT